MATTTATVSTAWAGPSQRHRRPPSRHTAAATMRAQATCTEGMAETSSGESAPAAAYTDCPYCAAVSVNPACGSSRGGATRMSETAKHAAVASAVMVRSGP